MTLNRIFRITGFRIKFYILSNFALTEEPQANLNKPDNSGSSRFKHYFLSFIYGVLACFTGFIRTIAVSRTEEAMEYGLFVFKRP
jgi:hypothetical protein